MSGGAAKTVQLVGRTTNFHGDTLWEIVGNLRNFGIGRMLIRKTFQRYPEPCYYKILEVKAVEAPTDELQLRKVKVLVEKTWRGITYPKPVLLHSCSYKPDFELIPKSEEHKYLGNTKKIDEKTIAKEVDLPPLFKEYIKDETGQKEPSMKVHFKKTVNRFVRLAQENEKPTIKVNMGLGKPASPKLYEGLL